MPKVSFYLRNEDLDKWKSIDKKTEFIHAALIVSATPARIIETVEGQRTLSRPIKLPKDITNKLRNPPPLYITKAFSARKKK